MESQPLPNAATTETLKPRRRHRRPAKSRKPEKDAGAAAGESGSAASGVGNPQEGQQQQQKPRRMRPPRQLRCEGGALHPVPEPNAQVPPNTHLHFEGEPLPPPHRKRVRRRKPPAGAAPENGGTHQHQHQRASPHPLPADDGAGDGSNARRRAFRAQLSAATPDVETPPQKSPSRVRIRPDAPEFVPCADDIISRIHREIGNGSYECMVCYGSVNRRAKIWSCRCCWAVYHLNCIQKWGKQGLQQEPRGPVGASQPQKSWRCPACNNPNTELPDLYTCWCEKETHPESTRYLPPHRYVTSNTSILGFVD